AGGTGRRGRGRGLRLPQRRLEPHGHVVAAAGTRRRATPPPRRHLAESPTPSPPRGEAGCSPSTPLETTHAIPPHGGKLDARQAPRSKPPTPSPPRGEAGCS